VLNERSKEMNYALIASIFLTAGVFIGQLSVWHYISRKFPVEYINLKKH
jgi:hypothetical protein